MEEKNNDKHIGIKTIIERIKNKKKLFLIVLTATFIISCALIVPVPRYYNSNVTLAPEIGNSGSEDKLSSMASSIGLNIGSSMSADALSPSMYPEIIESNDFILSLLNIKVKTLDGSVSTDYYTYLDEYQKSSIYDKVFHRIGSIFSSKKEKEPKKEKIDPFFLSKKQVEVFKAIQSNIKCDIDIKTNLITISVTDQDALIAATIANAVSAKLQVFITNYRTNKARNDLNYYKRLTAESKVAYERSRQIYGSYADANSDVLLQSFKSKEEDLENDMQLKFNTYSELNKQLQSAKAKVQERTPAFTAIQRASVSIRPAGPKRMAFVLTMMFLSFLVTFFYANKDIFIR